MPTPPTEDARADTTHARDTAQQMDKDDGRDDRSVSTAAVMVEGGSGLTSRASATKTHPPVDVNFMCKYAEVPIKVTLVTPRDDDQYQKEICFPPSIPMYSFMPYSHMYDIIQIWARGQRVVVEKIMVKDEDGKLIPNETEGMIIHYVQELIPDTPNMIQIWNQYVDMQPKPIWQVTVVGSRGYAN